ncbi:STAS domain-containing protein [Streptomyces solincola]|uniref:STAS domain-containing protein n=1 Tax=Streptomyces solincola TaxID=2100817 RepID=UPI002159070C|nr:STAS domain-containing protein [Streptomyces solincola]
MSSGDPDVHVREQSGVRVVALAGELDLDYEQEMSLALADALASATRGTVVDLSGVAFADSTLLNLLLQTTGRHRTAHRPLAICGPFTPAVHNLFDITQTAGHLPLAVDLDQALTDIDKTAPGP